MEDRTVFFTPTIGGTSNATTLTGTLPVSAAVEAQIMCRVTDNTTQTVGFAYFANGSATINFYANVADGAWSTGAAKGINRAALYYKI